MTTRIRVFPALFSISLLVNIAGADPTPSPTPPPVQLREDYFIPKGGYLGTVRRDQLQRQQATRRLVQGAPPVGGLKGNRALPVICVNFKNVPAPFPVAEYEQLIFGSGPNAKTMTQYYADMSNDKLHVTGKVVGWYELPKDDTFYENNEQGGGEPLGELLHDALEKADAEIDFGQFDNDGPDGVPNSGDDDGKVDTLVIIHSDCGGECDNAASPHIRSRSAHYSDAAFFHSEKPFVTRAIRRDVGGAPKLGPDGKAQHIIVDDLIIVPGIACPQDSGPGRITQIGVLCHEYGHALGLPDLYDRNLRSNGAGDWCLMAYGCYGGDHQHMDTPASMSAWCKQFLGWANVQVVASSGEIQLESVEDRNMIYRFNIPDTNDKEYFLVEYRNSTWKPLAGSRINWDYYLPGSGLAIWHVDERVGKQIAGPSPIPNDNWPFAPPDQGQNDAPTLPNGNNTGYRSDHSLVALVEADGTFNLAKGRSYGTKGNLWTSGSFEDDPSFIRGSRAYDGRPTGIALTAINLTDYTALAQNSAITSPQIANTNGPQTIPTQSPNSVSMPAIESATGTTTMSASAARATINLTAAPPIPPPQANSADGGEAQTPARRLNSSLIVHRLAATDVVAPERAESLRNVNQALNAASVKLNELPRSADDKNLAPNLNEELEKQGFSKISQADLANIATAQPAEIRREIQADNRPLVQALGTEARTKEVATSAKPSTAAESDILKLMRDAKQKQPVQIQSSPEGTRIERVTNLSIPSKTTDVSADAGARVKQDLQKVIGVGIKLQQKESPISQSPDGSVVRFEQVVQSGGKSLPVFGKETALYYSTAPKPTFTAVTNGTVSASALKVTGAPGELSPKEAEEIVSKELRLDPDEVGEGGEGVYLVGDNPKNGRVAVEVPVHVDEHHADIKVFVDSQTKEILEIK
jgi:M6 family metalloprotease-like protein